jgi:cap2 methyltransferase
MKSFKLTTEKSNLLLNTNNDKKYRFKSLDSLKLELINTKNKLDNLYSKNKFATYWSNFDPFKLERNVVAEIGGTYNVSNAWLKCYEILNYYNLIPTNIDENYTHFDNAAFPGSFIIATHHYIKTMRNSNYKWKASSLLIANESNQAPLEDKYGLFNEYRNNWMMHKNNNGDVLNELNQIDFCKLLGNSVDLYTSDLGFDVSSDYNNQELLQLPANIGQIITGLLILKKGGSFIVKQYTVFEPITISVMYIVNYFFDEFYLCKPFTSRMANSETYLVGKGFKGGVYLNHPYIRILLDKISKRSKLELPIFNYNEYDKKYIKTIINAKTDLITSQIEKINLDIERTLNSINNNFKGNPINNPIVIEFRKNNEDSIIKWYYNNPIKYIKNTDMLTMINALNQ